MYKNGMDTIRYCGLEEPNRMKIWPIFWSQYHIISPQLDAIQLPFRKHRSPYVKIYCKSSHVISICVTFVQVNNFRI